MEKVVVAMSGGVDSSVAALLLRDQGYEVVGVHLRLHNASLGLPGRCCGLRESHDAASVAETLGIPFHVLDLRAEFQRLVVDDFVSTYMKGHTPSPCILCNEIIKFDALFQGAKAIGARWLATGHYARVDHEPPGLRCAADPRKDQTYFLFSVKPSALSSTLLPLGDLSKDRVREIARQAGLPVHSKRESQEICFIPDDDHASFLDERLAPDQNAGPILDESGRVLGEHHGFHHFTIGQRRGLGIALGQARYVVSIRPESQSVVVGPLASLNRGELFIERTNWFRRPHPDERVAVRIRHQGLLYPCYVEEDEPCRVRLLSPARAVTPGQAAVFYELPPYASPSADGQRLLGGGWILGDPSPFLPETPSPP